MLRNNLSVWCLVLTAAVVLPGCDLYDDVFGDDTIERRVPAPLVPLTVDRVSMTRLWSVSLDSDKADSISPPAPHLEEQALFAADSEGAVIALDPVTGNVRWRTGVPGKMLGAVSAGPEHVYVGTQEQQVIALSREDGQIVWQTNLSSEVFRVAHLSDGHVAVRTNNTRLYMLSTKDGSVLWQIQRKSPILTMRGMSAPFAWQNMVLVGFDDGKLAAYDMSTGKTRYETRLAFPLGRLELEQVVDIDGGIVVEDSTAYVPVFNRLLAAVGVQTGSVYWTRDVRLTHGAASDGVVLMATDFDGQVWALNAENGDVYWRVYDLLYRETSAPALAGLHGVVADFEGYLHWLRILDGTIEGRHRLDAPLQAPPMIQDDRIYLQTADGTLSAYRFTIAPYKAGTQPKAATESAEPAETTEATEPAETEAE